jgi:nickel transport protein
MIVSRLVPALALAATLLFGSAGPLSAHDAWITLSGPAEARRAVVNYGHPDDRPAAFADKVVDLVAITAKARSSLLDGLAAASENGVQIARSKPFEDAGHTLLAARYDNGFWVKTTDGLYRNATRRLVPDAAESFWSGKFAKALSGADAPWQEVLGHDLELVPLSDPAKARPGETLKVKVLFRGKPLAEAEVERGDGKTAVAEKDIPKFKTDADGVATIPIAKPGAHLLVIDHRTAPSATPDQATADLYNATLWFNVGGKRR